MTSHPFWRNLDAAELRQRLARLEPIVLIDVRSPQEYESGHIPGARLMPLPEFEASAHELEPGTTHVIYCRSGVRSLRASMIAAGIDGVTAWNLVGGIAAWRGDVLPGRPDLSVFAGASDLASGIRIAARLERATAELYRRLASVFDGPARETFDMLARAEETHALQLGTTTGEPAGPTMESGGNLESVLADAIGAGASSREDALELALAMEYAAMDLYENLAAQPPARETASMYSDRAREERRHAAALVALFGNVAD